MVAFVLVSFCLRVMVRPVHWLVVVQSFLFVVLEEIVFSALSRANKISCFLFCFCYCRCCFCRLGEGKRTSKHAAERGVWEERGEGVKD